jgi:hypothetical protein
VYEPSPTNSPQAGDHRAAVAKFGPGANSPGLRREELAQLAGVSVTHYTRLEQGQRHQASESVIESQAALRLLWC